MSTSRPSSATLDQAEQAMRHAQALCVQVEADLAALKRFSAQLPAMQRRARQLQAYHTEQWLEDVTLLESAPQRWQQVHDEAPEGHYSVLAQDTVWDALREFDSVRIALLKQLVRELR